MTIVTTNNVLVVLFLCKVSATHTHTPRMAPYTSLEGEKVNKLMIAFNLYANCSSIQTIYNLFI